MDFGRQRSRTTDAYDFYQQQAVSGPKTQPSRMPGNGYASGIVNPIIAEAQNAPPGFFTVFPNKGPQEETMNPQMSVMRTVNSFFDMPGDNSGNIFDLPPTQSRQFTPTPGQISQQQSSPKINIKVEPLKSEPRQVVYSKEAVRKLILFCIAQSVVSIIVLIIGIVLIVKPQALTNASSPASMTDLQQLSTISEKLKTVLQQITFPNGTLNIPEGFITTKLIAREAVVDANIATVSASKLSGNLPVDLIPAKSIDNSRISSLDCSKLIGALSPNLIRDSSLSGRQFEDASIPSSKLASGINGGKLEDDSIDGSKISSVSGTKIEDGTIANSKIQSVSSSKVEGTFGTASIADGAIIDAKIATVSASKLVGTISQALIANNAIVDAKIANLAASKLIGPLPINIITDNSIPDAKIASISGSKISGNISGNIVLDNSIGDLKINSLNGAKLLANSVDNSKISALDGSKIANLSVTDSKIAAGISGSKILAGTITATQLAFRITYCGYSGGRIDTAVGFQNVAAIDLVSSGQYTVTFATPYTIAPVAFAELVPIGTTESLSRCQVLLNRSTTSARVVCFVNSVLTNSNFFFLAIGV